MADLSKALGKQEWLEWPLAGTGSFGKQEVKWEAGLRLLKSPYRHQVDWDPNCVVPTVVLCLFLTSLPTVFSTSRPL